jgi:S-adenosylmethionine:tRNA ribosyltransferase-isomerase
MNLDQFDYHLPDHLIADTPAPQRDGSRLLVLYRDRDELQHCRFRDLPSFLSPHDLLILNDTRVLPARLVGKREATGGRWEGLFLHAWGGLRGDPVESPRALNEGVWELLCQTRGHLHPGEILLVEAANGEVSLPLRLVEQTSTGAWRARPLCEPQEVIALLERFGRVPLPPYIRKQQTLRGTADEKRDVSRYQTIYAAHEGAVAAPTAGLHFTPEMFESLRRQQVNRAFVTLHVGPGTFRPVQVEDVAQHHMEAEWACLPEQTAQAIRHAREQGGRIVAVGTTSVRVLETARTPEAWSGWTDLTICPPYPFALVDALITNFHLPRSSLLLLVAAFAGTERILTAYRSAVAQGYRFYSYGDAMLIL